MFGLFRKQQLEPLSKLSLTGPALHLLQEATDYLQLLYSERGERLNVNRLVRVASEIQNTGTYQHTTEELVYGAKLAWRNNTKCIGRLHWQTLTVRDMRHLTTEEKIFDGLCDHIRFATNGGKIKSTATVFAAQVPGEEGIQIWNPQLIRYAGHRKADGSVVGDPLHVDLTDAIEEMGWRGDDSSPFDILPIVIQLPGKRPKMFDIPRDLVLEVEIQHPDYPWFRSLGLRWHALPVISNMRMEIGGISYTAAPFNGWYMGTEVGARNLADVNRYNLLPIVARGMGLDTSSDRTLWKDRALVELNVAVLSSFAARGVTIVDHHTASRQFMLHDAREQTNNRPVHAHWPWLVPPLSGALSPIFHVQTYKNIKLKPNFFYQASPWQSSRKLPVSQCPMAAHS